MLKNKKFKRNANATNNRSGRLWFEQKYNRRNCLSYVVLSGIANARASKHIATCNSNLINKKDKI